MARGLSERRAELKDRLREAQEASSTLGGKSVSRQLYEMLRLRLGPTRLGLGDYSLLRLADRDLYEDRDLSEFAGNAMRRKLNAELNSPLWDAVVSDKLIMTLLFETLDIPQPELYAVACRFTRSAGGYPVFNTADELAEFLAERASYPLFCKPIKGGSADGVKRVEAYDAETGTLHVVNGGHQSIDEFIRSLDDPSGWGYLIQAAVVAHPDTMGMCGDAVSGCRLVMLLDDDGVRPFRVVWKLPVDGMHTDNFQGGNGGVSVADVDVNHGTVRRVIGGGGASLEVNAPHGPNRVDVLGRKVPCWDDMMAMMPRLATSFPGFRFQHWDIGLTRDGPVAYELNTAGGLRILEASSGTGAMDRTLKAFLGAHEPQARRTKYRGVPPVSIE